MKLNIEKIKEETKRFDQELQQEYYINLPEGRINLLNNQVINNILSGTKYSKSEDIPARNLNNWIKEGVIVIEKADNKKIKRFTKLQCMWLNVVKEARMYGMNLNGLKVAYSELMQSHIPNFSYFKMAVINTIFSESQILNLSYTGICNIRSATMQKKFEEKQRYADSSLVIPLDRLIKSEFPNSCFDLELDIEGKDTDEEKMLLWFLLKTGSYDTLTFYLDDYFVLTDPQPITPSDKKLYEAVTKWKFNRVEIVLEDGSKTIINNRKHAIS